MDSHKERLRKEKEAAVAADNARREERSRTRVRVSHNGISQQSPSPTPTNGTPPAKSAEEVTPPLNLDDGKIRVYITLNDDRGVERVDWDPRLTAYSALLATIEAQVVIIPSMNKFLSDALDRVAEEAKQETTTNG